MLPISLFDVCAAERFSCERGITISTFSFGYMNLPERREHATKADLARSTLVTVLNNIGSISMMCARTEVMESIQSFARYCLRLACRSSPVQWKLPAHQRSVHANPRLRHGLLVQRKDKSYFSGARSRSPVNVTSHSSSTPFCLQGYFSAVGCLRKFILDADDETDGPPAVNLLI
jgi:hypothetical protein